MNLCRVSLEGQDAGGGMAVHEEQVRNTVQKRSLKSERIVMEPESVPPNRSDYTGEVRQSLLFSVVLPVVITER